METIQRILCPIDFSEDSRRTFEYAEKLARETNAELIVAHAFDIPKEYATGGQIVPADTQIAKKMEAIEPSTPLPGFRRMLHAGAPGNVICWLAQDQRCDLIVMGAHNKGPLSSLLFGSASEFVLRHARCPVLVVRHRRENEVVLQEPRVIPPPPPRLM